MASMGSAIAVRDEIRIGRTYFNCRFALRTRYGLVEHGGRSFEWVEGRARLSEPGLLALFRGLILGIITDLDLIIMECSSWPNTRADTDSPEHAASSR